METVVAMKQVRKAFGKKRIYDRLDLELFRGETLAVLGASGVGKSVLLKMIIGLHAADAGSIVVGGVDVTALPENQLRDVRKKVGMLFQGAALFDSMTVGENVGYRMFEEGRLSEGEIERIVLEKLSFVGVEQAVNLYPAELSGGMKKRVAIARALAANPDYIFFDEPTTGLDPIGVYNICNLMQRLQAEGKTTLMVTHDLATAFATSERFTFLHQARMIFEGTEAEMRASTIPEVQEFLQPTKESLFV
jgi:phospholipid/cholesterol/gamma-HCH transport system ATP-binding protein